MNDPLEKIASWLDEHVASQDDRVVALILVTEVLREERERSRARCHEISLAKDKEISAAHALKREKVNQMHVRTDLKVASMNAVITRLEAENATLKAVIANDELIARMFAAEDPRLKSLNHCTNYERHLLRAEYGLD